MAKTNYTEIKVQLETDSAIIDRILDDLSTIGTPQAQQTDGYKHLRDAIESLGAMKAILDNNLKQIIRLERAE
jgi:hypothetical protein